VSLAKKNHFDKLINRLISVFAKRDTKSKKTWVNVKVKGINIYTLTRMPFYMFRV